MAWELSVRDSAGRTLTFTYEVKERKEAIALLAKKARWSVRKTLARLVVSREVRLG